MFRCCASARRGFTGLHYATSSIGLRLVAGLHLEAMGAQCDVAALTGEFGVASLDALG